MTRCGRCEVRVGHSLDPCDCTAVYRSPCGRCEEHCRCDPAAVWGRVGLPESDATAGRGIRLSRGRG